MKLPYELYTQQRIVNHLENSSPTKFMYSFSRAKRFPSVERRGFSDALYVFPGIGTGRKVGIGKKEQKKTPPAFGMKKRPGVYREKEDL